MNYSIVVGSLSSKCLFANLIQLNQLRNIFCNVTLQTFPLKKRNQFIVEYIHYICERFSTEMSTLLSIICLDSFL